MTFSHPIWLLVLLAALPLLWWTFRRFDRSRATALRQFASGHLLADLTASVSTRLRRLRRGLLLGGIALALLSLARPQFGFRWEEAHRRGIDILIAVDTSRSMLAQDVKPDRLTRAKLAVLDLLERIDGDRVGLIAFAGTSFLQCPMTLDYDAFRQSLDALDTNIIPEGGTNLAAAIEEARGVFQLANPNHKILVLLTDGEDLEANGIAAAKAAAQEGVRIFTVGVGSSTGELIPIRNDTGGMDFVKDEKGQVVKSHLDEATLRQIAEATGGLYEPLGQQGQGLETIYQRGLASLPKQELASRMNKISIERFQWPLALAILCLALEMVVGDRRKKSKFRILNAESVRRPEGIRGFQLSILLLLVALPLTSHASPQSAEKAYRQGKFTEALAQYQAAAEKNSRRSELQHNLGAAAYKTGDFAKAAAAFQKALQTDQIPLQQQTFYNLGNALYRIGQATEKSQPQRTIPQWQQAIQSYENALKLKPKDADAKFNRDYVKKKLEELQKQNPPPKDQKQPPPQQDQKQNPDDKNSQQPPSPKDQQKQDSSHGDTQNKPPSGQPQTPDSKDGGQKPPPSNGPEDKGSQPEGNPPKEPDKAPSNRQPAGRRPPESPEPKPLPGQMSREEARNLLDSLKGDERKMPITPATEGKPAGQENPPRRDW